jgi:hypothetical protein
MPRLRLDSELGVEELLPPYTISGDRRTPEAQ